MTEARGRVDQRDMASPAARRHPGRRRLATVGAVLAAVLFAVAAATAFAVLVVCGYLVPWAWTGFRGNTAWDWIRLLLVPVLVPVILLPALSQRVANRLAPPEPSAA